MATSLSATEPLRAQGQAPADAAAIEKAVAAVAREIEHVKAQLYQTVNTHYGEFVSTVKSTGDLNAKVADVGRTVRLLAEQVDNTQVIRPAVEIQQLKTEIASSEALVLVLKQLAQDIDGDLDIGEYVQAARRVQQMTDLVAALGRQREAGVDSTILQLVKDEYIKRKAALKHALDDLFARGVAIRTSSSETEVVCESRIHSGSAPNHDSPVSWVDVLTALDVLGSLEEHARGLCARLHAEVLLPLLRTVGATVAVRQLGKTSSALVVTYPRQSMVSGAANRSSVTSKRRVSLDAASTELLASACATLAQFVAATVLPAVFRETEASVSPVRDRLPPSLWWLPFSDAVVQEVLEVALPDRADGLATYSSTVANTARGLEDKLIGLGLASATDRRLSDWTAQATVHFWEKRRVAALVMARELLAGTDHNTVQVTNSTERGGLTAGGGADKASTGAVGNVAPEHTKEGKETIDHTDGLFQLRPCHISTRTQALVEMVYQTLSECKTADPMAAMQLYYSARDMLDLFRAVVPIYHATEIETVPLLALIFVNDCNYIVHHLMTLGYQFQSYLPSPLKETATFVDMVPLFRRLAEHYYRLQMRKQAQQLEEFMAGAQGFGDTNKDDRYQAVSRSLTQASLQLNLLAKVWSPTLTSELYLASMGTLVDVVLAAVVREIQALRDVAETETRQLHQLHQSLQSRVEPLFTHRDATTGAVSTVAPAKYCRQWDRFAVVDRLLTISVFSFGPAGGGEGILHSLQDIAAEWESGALRAFTAAEVRSMVMAVFGESTRREQTLRKLRE